jgi:hypothetical protein
MSNFHMNMYVHIIKNEFYFLYFYKGWLAPKQLPLGMPTSEKSFVAVQLFIIDKILILNICFGLRFFTLCTSTNCFLRENIFNQNNKKLSKKV